MIKSKKFQYIFDLITELAKKELKVRYKNSVLGYLWSVLSPLTSALVFFVAFKIVMRFKIDNYVLFLISGLFCWQWYTNSIFASAKLFLENSTLIKKVNFPRDALVYSMVINDLVHFVLAIPIVLLFIVIYKQKFPTLIIVLPLILVFQFLLVSGVSLIISSLNLFFRDLERLIIIFTNLLFYITPIIYPESMVPQKYKFVIYFNPMAYFVIIYRNIFMNNQLNLTLLLASILYSVIVFLIGYGIYKSLEWRFAEIV